MKDEYYMKKALKEAEIALKEGNWPIGCVIELGESIIARAHNQTYSLKNKLAHAEVLALNQAQKDLYTNLKQATLYTTYEPCPMCFGASVLSRIKKIVCGIDLDNSGATYLKENLPLCFKQDEFEIEVLTGVLAKECAEIFMKSEHAKKLNKQGLLRKLQNRIDF